MQNAHPPSGGTVGEEILLRGVSRRDFLAFCSSLAALMALPPGSGEAMAAALSAARRQSVIWLSFQECTGCTESLTRSHSPTLENLLFDLISLDYHHTLQAASGEAAEAARRAAMATGNYLVVVDGAVPLGNPAYCTIAGVSALDMLRETVAQAAAVVAVGSCAAYGGLPAARPNPTGAVAISSLVTGKPVVNVPGCPPIPTVITGTLAYFLTFGRLPELDGQGRPKAFYGETIHDRCYRRPFYDQGKFAESFDDEGARKGWCLYKLGCRGPVTYNACATTKWNGGVSFPIQSGHGCLGCSEAKFWDMGPFYQPLPAPGEPLNLAGAAAAGVAVGLAAWGLNQSKKDDARAAHEPVGVEDLTKAKPE